MRPSILTEGRFVLSHRTFSNCLDGVLWVINCFLVLRVFLLPLNLPLCCTWCFYDLQSTKTLAKGNSSIIYLGGISLWLDILWIIELSGISYWIGESRELSLQPAYETIQGVFLRNFFSGRIWLAQFLQTSLQCMYLFAHALDLV